MFCPVCGTENESADFCRDCHTNLAIIEKFVNREDAKSPRGRIISRTGLVSVVVSEGFAWTIFSLLMFMLIILLVRFFLPIDQDFMGDLVIASIGVLVLILFCGVPLLLGLVLLLKDITYVRKDSSHKEAQKD
jgi:hypothetical protein